MFLIIGRFGQRYHCRLPICDCQFSALFGRCLQCRTRSAKENKLVARNRQLEMSKITSHDNSLLHRARAVRDGKIHDSIFIEGLRLCEESLKSELKIEAVIYSERLAKKERAADLIHE